MSFPFNYKDDPKILPLKFEPLSPGSLFLRFSRLSPHKSFYLFFEKSTLLIKDPVINIGTSSPLILSGKVMFFLSVNWPACYAYDSQSSGINFSYDMAPHPYRDLATISRFP